MVMLLVRRLVASATLFLVAVGGGGMPVLDGLVFHGPSRLAESLRSHYEASSACHGDVCSIRSDAQPRTPGDLPPQGLAVVALEQPEPVPCGESIPSSAISLQYLSRAPPDA